MKRELKYFEGKCYFQFIILHKINLDKMVLSEATWKNIYICFVLHRKHRTFRTFREEKGRIMLLFESGKQWEKS